MLIGQPNRVGLVIDSPEGTETIFFTFPATGDKEFETGKKKLLNNRIIMKGRRTINRANEERSAFFDQWCSQVEGLEIMEKGKRVDLMSTDGWKGMVGVEMKVSVVAQHFEEKETLTEEDREDLTSASAEA